MKNLTTAIYGKIAGSSFSSSIGGRFYKVGAPQGVVWPYAVFFVVTDSPADTFTEHIEDVVVQFSLFSNDPESTSEIEDMAANLKALFDSTTFAVTGNTMIEMERIPSGGIEQLFDDTPTGTQRYFMQVVEYKIILQKT